MRRLKKDDMVVFLQNYKDLVQKGETRPIDRAIYLDGVLKSVFIKAETNYIYFDGGDFEWYCKPYENKNVECKVVYEYLNAKKQMENKVGKTYELIRNSDTLKCKMYKGEYGTVREVLNSTIIFEFDGKRHLSIYKSEFDKYFKEMKDYDFEQEVINEIDRKSQIIDKEMEKNKNYDHINPNHYKQGDKEVIEMMVDIWGAEDVAKYCSMNAFKYRMRMGFKPNQPVEQELKKATWYEDKAKELRNEQK